MFLSQQNDHSHILLFPLHQHLHLQMFVFQEIRPCSLVVNTQGINEERVRQLLAELHHSQVTGICAPDTIFVYVPAFSLRHISCLFLEAIREQAGTIMQTFNYPYTVPQALLAEKICTTIGMDKIFYQNTGTEANEATL